MREFNIDTARCAFVVMNPPPEGVRFFECLGRYAHTTIDWVGDELGVKLQNYNQKWELFLQGYKLGCGQTFDNLSGGVDEIIIRGLHSEEEFLKLYLHEKFLYLYRITHDGNKV